MLPAINNRRVSPNFIEHIDGNNINYTQSSTVAQAETVLAHLQSINPLCCMC